MLKVQSTLPISVEFGRSYITTNSQRNINVSVTFSISARNTWRRAKHFHNLDRYYLVSYTEEIDQDTLPCVPEINFQARWLRRPGTTATISGEIFFSSRKRTAETHYYLIYVQ